VVPVQLYIVHAAVQSASACVPFASTTHFAVAVSQLYFVLHVLEQSACACVPAAAWAHVPFVGSQSHLNATHALLQSASVFVPFGSATHLPVRSEQLNGLHVAAQVVFVSVPDPATHLLVAGSVHV
jgi:hypothetical protein